MILKVASLNSSQPRSLGRPPWGSSQGHLDSLLDTVASGLWRKVPHAQWESQHKPHLFRVQWEKREPQLQGAFSFGEETGRGGAQAGKVFLRLAPLWTPGWRGSRLQLPLTVWTRSPACWPWGLVGTRAVRLAAEMSRACRSCSCGPKVDENKREPSSPADVLSVRLCAPTAPSSALEAPPPSGDVRGGLGGARLSPGGRPQDGRYW